MGKTNFGLNVVAAILKFKMAAYAMIPNVIFTCFIGFLDQENTGIATKTILKCIFKRICKGRKFREF